MQQATEESVFSFNSVFIFVSSLDLAMPIIYFFEILIFVFVCLNQERNTKREVFRNYLEPNGILDTLTIGIVSLFLHSTVPTMILWCMEISTI